VECTKNVRVDDADVEIDEDYDEDDEDRYTFV
jgi:hypothetical protein